MGIALDGKEEVKRALVTISIEKALLELASPHMMKFWVF